MDKKHSAAATISTDLFLALGMTPNCANTTSKNIVKKSLRKDHCNSRKLRKVLVIYKTNKLVLSKKQISSKIWEKNLTQKVAFITN